MLSTGHSDLIREIKTRIVNAKASAISFAEFMELCLYHPKWGYYQVPVQKLGKDGDFYTSAGIGSIMGEITARYFLQYAKSSYAHASSFHYIEWGGGNGKWARDMLDTIAELSPDHYEKLRWTAIEGSPFHRKRMAESLAAHTAKVTIIDAKDWESHLAAARSERPGEVQFVFGNEFLDAFPVHRIGKTSEAIEEIGVGWDEGKQSFIDAWMPLTKNMEEEVNDRQIELTQHQVAEINLGLQAWFKRMYDQMKEGMLLLLDYGDVREELYAPHRMNGTLMCYRKHKAHDDPYQFIGEQDITSHVDFTACMEAAECAGFVRMELHTQKQWLLDHNVLGLLQEHAEPDPFAPVVRRNRAIRQLLLSDSISELFKVLSMVKTP